MSFFRLAILGGVGYLIYRMVSEGTESGTESRSQGGRQRQRRGEGMGKIHQSDTGAQMSGPGAGTVAEVADSGGGTTRRTVGRGVVRR